MIPLITYDRAFFDQVVADMQESHVEAEFVHIDNPQQAAEYMRVEMPELIIVNFADDKLDIEELFNAIKSDSWLFTSGIIVICESPQALRKSELIHGTNTLSLIKKTSVKSHLPHVLTIIGQNRHMLFQGVIGADLGNNISASFRLNNSTVEADVFVNLISNYLYNINRIDAGQKDQLMFVLHEFLINAIEHGNCEITFDEKSAWLEKGLEIHDLHAKKCEDSEIEKRKVVLEYHIHDRHTAFKIIDEGKGFNWRKVPDHMKDSGELVLHGRGIVLCQSMTQNLQYNDKGNAIEFDFEHQKLVANTTPALFNDLETVSFSRGDIVFNQGDPGNYLYYIAQGEYEVLVDDTQVSTLSPDDVFLGEMSFLLNNRRSATIRALSAGRMIRISRKEFIDGIKEKPHYSILLSRLLAKRLERLNHQMGILKSQI